MVASNINDLDWLDIGLHVVIAIAGIVILSWLGVPLEVLFAVNTIVWPARELWQHRPDYKEIFTHPQPLFEWVCPLVAGLITTAALILNGLPA